MKIKVKLNSALKAASVGTILEHSVHEPTYEAIRNGALGITEALPQHLKLFPERDTIIAITQEQFAKVCAVIPYLIQEPEQYTDSESVRALIEKQRADTSHNCNAILDKIEIRYKGILSSVMTHLEGVIEDMLTDQDISDSDKKELLDYVESLLENKQYIFSECHLKTENSDTRSSGMVYSSEPYIVLTAIDVERLKSDILDKINSFERV